jgi:hypothetical protein
MNKQRLLQRIDGRTNTLTEGYTLEVYFKHAHATVCYVSASMWAAFIVLDVFARKPLNIPTGSYTKHIQYSYKNYDLACAPDCDLSTVEYCSTLTISAPESTDTETLSIYVKLRLLILSMPYGLELQRLRDEILSFVATA